MGDLVTHITMGLPMGWNAVLISRLAPRALAWHLIWLTQRVWLPFRLLKSFVNRVVIGLNKPFGNCFDESPTAVKSFHESALQRVCALEATAPYVEPVVFGKDSNLEATSTRKPSPRGSGSSFGSSPGRCFVLCCMHVGVPASERSVYKAIATFHYVALATSRVFRSLRVRAARLLVKYMTRDFFVTHSLSRRRVCFEACACARLDCL